jgi:hypothetical protein
LLTRSAGIDPWPFGPSDLHPAKVSSKINEINTKNFAAFMMVAVLAVQRY